MLNIQDYARRIDVNIKVDSLEEMTKLIPILNTVYSGWNEVNHTCTGFKWPRYIKYSSGGDYWSDESDPGAQIIEAKEFIDGIGGFTLESLIPDFKIFTDL